MSPLAASRMVPVAVVLLEAEQLRPRVVAAELLEVPGARAPEAVNRVVGDDAASNEVMRALDVEIIDLARVWLSLDALHDVEAVRVGRDHHAGSDSRSRDEGQRALVHEPLQHQLRVELIADAPRDRHQLAKVLAHRLEPPAPV